MPEPFPFAVAPGTSAQAPDPAPSGGAGPAAVDPVRQPSLTSPGSAWAGAATASATSATTAAAVGTGDRRRAGRVSTRTTTPGFRLTGRPESARAPSERGA